MAIDKAVDSTQLNADLTTVADAIRERGETSAPLSFPDGMAAAVLAIPEGGPGGEYDIISEDNGDGTQNLIITDAEGGGGIDVEPLSVTANGTYTAPSKKAYSPVAVNVPTGTARSASDLTVSGATVTAPAGLYAQAASKSVASGTAGTPTATKGAVSNHSVQVTPSVNNTTGFITGGTKNGTPVTVTAAELVSGSETKTQNGTYDVTNLAQLVVNVQGGGETYEIVAETMPNYVHNSYVTLGMKIDSEGNLTVSKVSGSGSATNLVICEGWDGNTFDEDDVITKVDIPQAEGTYDKQITVWWDNSSGVHGDNTSKGKTDANKWTISYTVVKAGGGGEITTQPLTVTANGTYTAPSGKAYTPVTVNVAGDAGKNKQYSAVMKNIKGTTMTATGASITVQKTGTYKCTWVHWAQAAGSNYSNYSSQLYVAGSSRGSVHYAPIYNNTTATNYVCTENNVSLTAGQTVEVRARSQGSNNFINAGMLVIEEL